MQADLVFRRAHQECAHNSQEISGFAAELVFREVPGKLVQWGGNTQRLWRPFLGDSPLETIAGGVVRVLRTPPRLGPSPSRRLALRLTASMLALPDPRIRTEPVATDGAGSLPESGHRDPSSPCPQHTSRAAFKSGRLGHFWRAEVGNFSRAPKHETRLPDPCGKRSRLETGEER